MKLVEGNPDEMLPPPDGHRSHQNAERAAEGNSFASAGGSLSGASTSRPTVLLMEEILHLVVCCTHVRYIYIATFGLS